MLPAMTRYSYNRHSRGPLKSGVRRVAFSRMRLGSSGSAEKM